MTGKMILGERKLGAATCFVRGATALPKHMQQGCREITTLLTKDGFRRQGYATSLMHKMCREADKANLLLIVFPKPFAVDGDAMDQKTLLDWYCDSFGFSPIQTQPVILLARLPGSTPKMMEMTGIAESLQAHRSRKETL